MPAPASWLIRAVLGDLAALPAADRDVPAGRLPQLMAFLVWTPDPRDPRGVRHSLVSLLATVVAAVLTGARSLAAIGEWIADVPAGVRFVTLISVIRNDCHDLVMPGSAKGREVGGAG